MIIQVDNFLLYMCIIYVYIIDSKTLNNYKIYFFLVLHDFFTQFGRTKIFVEQKPKGYGLKCHRVIRTCCEALGITDLYAKIEGSKNVAYIVKAFFIGLLQQVC